LVRIYLSLETKNELHLNPQLPILAKIGALLMQGGKIAYTFGTIVLLYGGFYRWNVLEQIDTESSNKEFLLH